ncbi:N-acetyl-alpha-D-glucosaminyl-diphospho-ditrans,octacis-undecaprenol 4-epimerase [subsurface metagenome]|nr:NAD-dependent epimerase/dehydratase family protein [Dehalococcoidia bacterium]
MKILITGGSGFIGSRLVADLMALDHEIVIFDKMSSEQYPNMVVPGDVRDRNDLTHALTNVDLIYHLAAEHHDKVRPISLYQEVNVEGTANLITAAEKNGVEKIVFTSTIAIYGLRLNGQDESSTPAPFNEWRLLEKIFPPACLKDQMCTPRVTR